jgi:hypothetical protein
MDSPLEVNIYSPDDLVFPNLSDEGSGDDQRIPAMVSATRQMVLLEWRPLPLDSEDRERTLARLETTSHLLRIPRCSTLRTLDCPGYVIDRSCSIGGYASLAYQYPTHAAREQPRSLLQLMKEDTKDTDRPSLDDRYALAVCLAETVFQLHMSGWLHR